MVSDYQKEGQIVDSTIQTKQSPIQSTLSVPDHCVHDKPSSRQIQMGLEASIVVCVVAGANTDVRIDACKTAFGTLNAESGLLYGPSSLSHDGTSETGGTCPDKTSFSCCQLCFETVCSLIVKLALASFFGLCLYLMLLVVVIAAFVGFVAEGCMCESSENDRLGKS